MKRFFLVVMFFLLITVILGSFTYLFFDLTPIKSFLVFFVSLLVTATIFKKKKDFFEFDSQDTKEDEVFLKGKLLALLLNTLLIALGVTLLFYLHTKSSQEVLQSPWLAISKKFFVMMFLFYFVYIYLILKQLVSKTTLLVGFIISTSVALLIYKLGYGFDIHIHEAALNVIKEKGAIFPKTIYYSGMYAFDTIFSNLFFIPINFIQKIIVPIIMPSIIFIFANHFLKQKSGVFILALILSPILPIFIVSTPYAMAFCLLILEIIILSQFYIEKENNSVKFFIWAYLIAIACFTVHPLPGIVALLYPIIIFTYKKYGYGASIAASVATAFALPVAFLFNEIQKTGFVGFKNLALRAAEFDYHLFLPQFYTINHYSVLLNFIYAWGAVLIVFYIFVSLLGIFTELKNGYKKNTPQIFAGCSIFLSYIIIIIFNRHPMVIGYEANDFANRALTIFYALLFPLFLIGMMRLLNTYKINTNFKNNIIIVFIFSALICSSIYLAYPRIDRAYSTHEYNTSIYDINTVKKIKDDAEQNLYFVLANQQVSAAAIKTLGFQETTNTKEGKTYIYPIPTGGELYKYYLEIVNNNYLTPQTVKNATEFMKIKKVYIVINDYWWRSKELNNSLTKIAKKHFSVDNGKTNVFLFEE